MRRLLFWPSLFVFAVALTGGHAAHIDNLSKVIATGDPAPDTDGLSIFINQAQQPVVLNESNEVAFIGSVVGGNGIWAGSPLRLAALDPGEAPGTAGAQFSSFSAFALADNGPLLFEATLKDQGWGPPIEMGFGWGRRPTCNCWCGPAIQRRKPGRTSFSSNWLVAPK